MKFDKIKVAKLMKTLAISEQEAIDLMAFDEGETENEEVSKIEEKVEKTAKPKGSPLDKVKNAKAKKKTDENKSQIFEALETLTKSNPIFINAQVMSTTKISFMDKDGNFYTFALTKHKTKPDGYSME